jgi:hypothetical protein
MQKVFWISAKCQCGPKNKTADLLIHTWFIGNIGCLDEPTPWIHKYTHEEKRKKKKKWKSLDGLAIMGETHALKLENEVY